MAVGTVPTKSRWNFYCMSMAACWSASEPAIQGDAAPDRRQHGSKPPAWPGDLQESSQMVHSSSSPWGIGLTVFFLPVSVGEWNRVEWKHRPSLHDNKTQESLSHSPDDEGGMTSCPWAAKAIQENPVLPDPGPLPGAEAEAGRVWPKAWQLGEVSVISSLLDESIFHDELKRLVWACLFFFFLDFWMLLWGFPLAEELWGTFLGHVSQWFMWVGKNKAVTSVTPEVKSWQYWSQQDLLIPQL